MSRTLKRGQDPRDPYTPTRQRVGSQGVPPTSRPTPRFVHDEPVGVPAQPPVEDICPYCGAIDAAVLRHCARCNAWRMP
jgi:hypothetical protein